MNCISHLLKHIPHKKLPRSKIDLQDRSMKHTYDVRANLKGSRFVPDKY